MGGMKRFVFYYLHDFKTVLLAVFGVIAMGAMVQLYFLGLTKLFVSNTYIDSEAQLAEHMLADQMMTTKEVLGNTSASETELLLKKVYKKKLENCRMKFSPSWDTFYNYLPKTGGCKYMYSFGGKLFKKNYFEGQKLVCMEEPVAPQKNNCTVISIGISTDWSFDDSMDNYGCQVYSFDPTLRQAQFNRSANIHFFPIGLSGRNEKKSREGFVEQYMTYRDLLEHVGLLGRTIDYLKMDIEGSEMDFFENVFRSDPQLLYHVKQIGMEIHVSKEKEKRNRLWTALHLLDCISFKRVYYEKNEMNLFKYKNSTESWCYELVWINELWGKYVRDQ